MLRRVPEVLGEAQMPPLKAPGTLPLHVGSTGSPGNSKGCRCQKETEQLDALSDSFCKQGPAASRCFRGFPESIPRWRWNASPGCQQPLRGQDSAPALFLSEPCLRGWGVSRGPMQGGCGLRPFLNQGTPSPPAFHGACPPPPQRLREMLQEQGRALLCPRALGPRALMGERSIGPLRGPRGPALRGEGRGVRLRQRVPGSWRHRG